MPKNNLEFQFCSGGGQPFVQKDAATCLAYGHEAGRKIKTFQNFR